MLGLARKAGMAVFLDPIETGGWLGVLRANGAAKDAAYGRFLGRRFRSFTNIVWMSGNDFQSWRDSSDDAVVLAVARGIRSVTPSRLQTAELNYLRSASRDDARWRGVITIDAAYTYMPTYAEVLREYNRRPALPVFMVEAGYEFEQNIPVHLVRRPRDAAAAGVLDRPERSDRPVLRQPLHMAVREGLEAAPRHARQRAAGLSGRTFRQAPLVPPRARPGAQGRDGRLRDVRPRRQRRLERLRHDRRDPRPEPLHLIPPRGSGRSPSPSAACVVRCARSGTTLRTGATGRWPGSPFPAVRSVVFTAPGANADGDRDWVLVLSRA